MRTEGNISKVAICPKCNNLILACHVDFLVEETEKEFTELTNEGFIVKLETAGETQARDFGSYLDCSKGMCVSNEQFKCSMQLSKSGKRCEKQCVECELSYQNYKL